MSVSRLAQHSVFPHAHKATSYVVCAFAASWTVPFVDSLEGKSPFTHQTKQVFLFTQNYFSLLKFFSSSATPVDDPEPVLIDPHTSLMVLGYRYGHEEDEIPAMRRLWLAKQSAMGVAEDEPGKYNSLNLKIIHSIFIVRYYLY